MLFLPSSMIFNYNLKICKLAEHNAVMTRRPSPTHYPLGLDFSLETIRDEGLALTLISIQ